MRYKKTKKAQKPKSSQIVFSKLIAERRFEDMITIFNQKPEFKKQDPYLYGYALLRNGKKLESLMSLWPLAAKGDIALQNDCAIIAAHIFKDEAVLSSTQLSEEALYTLFLVARSLMPQSQIYHMLKQRFFDFLWEKGDYEKIERILKSTKEEFSGVLVENFSKLAFFQAEKKFTGSIPGFVSHVLTGGACLIARSPLYHRDIAEEVHLLASELKYAFSELKGKQRHNSLWNQSLFENFVDYEAGILTQVLGYVIKENELNLDIIPTPNYLMTYDATGQMSQRFLSWLASKDETLYEMYNANMCRVVLWIFRGEKSDIQAVLKSIHLSKLPPYLRLALMFRGINLKLSSLQGIVQIGEIENLKETTTSLFKNVAIQTIKAMMNKEKLTLPSEFWEMLLAFYPVLEDQAFKNRLITQSILILHKEREANLSLNFDTLKSIVRRTNATALEKKIDVLCTRQALCLKFLLDLKDIKKSKKYIDTIKSEASLRAHLTLLVDACCLVFTSLSIDFFQHVKSLVDNRKVNRFIALADYFDFDFLRGCARCQRDLYGYIIPQVGKKLHLPMVCLPDIDTDSSSKMISETQTPRVSILSQADPFKILKVSFTEPKAMIMQKVMQLIQQSPEKMSIFRQAQNELFNPSKRFLHHYLRYLAYENGFFKTEVSPFLWDGISPLEAIPFRHEFLDAK